MAAILYIAQLQKMLNMPKVASSWFFMSRVYSTRICKKTSVMSQNEVMCHILQTTVKCFTQWNATETVTKNVEIHKTTY